MTIPDQHPIDARLAEALRERTRVADAELDQLWRTIVRAAETHPQRGAGRWPVVHLGRRPWLLAAAALLAVGAVGMTLLMAGGPGPDPLSVGPHNGPIYVTGDVGEGWLTVDLADGAVERARGMEHVIANGQRLSDTSWSPDGSRLAYVVGDVGDVFVVDIPGGSPVRIADCVALYRCGVAWSPDGTRIAVSDGGRVDLVDPDGLVEASFRIDAGRHVTQPAWSPAGDWIAYVSITASDDWAVWAIRPDGTDDHQVSAAAEPGMIALDPAWSPDGTRVFYLGQARHAGPRPNAARGGGDDTPDLQVLSVAVSGREEEPVLVDVVGRCWCINFGPSFAVAPDGSAFLVATQAMPVADGVGAQDGLFLIDAGTLEARFLGPGPVNSRVTWAPRP
ncbi:MAG: hypothetical protein OEV61_02590 [Chloroflexota bacterium]|nr:hypothetical protein [Chloroflexota bacterium]